QHVHELIDQRERVDVRIVEVRQCLAAVVVDAVGHSVLEVDQVREAFFVAPEAVEEAGGAEVDAGGVKGGRAGGGGDCGAAKREVRADRVRAKRRSSIRHWGDDLSRMTAMAA